MNEAVEKREAAYAARMADAWAPFVKLGPGPHSVNGKPLVTLGDYLAFVLAQAGQFNFVELQEEVRRLNSYTGTRALFSNALVGGRISTPTSASAKAASQTVGR